MEKKIISKELKYELALLIGSYTFLISKYMQAYKEGNLEDDIKPAITIINKVKSTISIYSKYHDDIAKLLDKAINSCDSSHGNTFLLGITLLNYHHEIKNKKIKVGLLSNVNSLVDSYIPKLEKIVIARTYEIAEAINEFIKKDIQDGH